MSFSAVNLKTCTYTFFFFFIFCVMLKNVASYYILCYAANILFSFMLAIALQLACNCVFVDELLFLSACALC